MNEREPEMERMPSQEVEERWSELLPRVAGGEARVVVEEDGKPVAAVISYEDLRLLERLWRRRLEAFEPLTATWEIFKDIPDEEVEREVARAIAEVRVENRERADAAARAS